MTTNAALGGMPDGHAPIRLLAHAPRPVSDA